MSPLDGGGLPPRHLMHEPEDSIHDLTAAQARDISNLEGLMRTMAMLTAQAAAADRSSQSDYARDSIDLVITTINDVLMPDIRQSILLISNPVEE